MLTIDFENSLGYWAYCLAQAFERAMNEELAPHGITMQQWKVLAWLAIDGELSQSELAERLKVEPPTLAGILDRMERDAWIARVPSPQDRRKKIVRPQPRVQSIWTTMVQCAYAVRKRATQGVSQEALCQALGVLKQVLDNFRDSRVVPCGERPRSIEPTPHQEN